MKHLRKLCGIFDILPSSFTLAQRPDKCEATPFDSGGSSDVYKATLEERPVVIKTLKVNSATNPKKAHRVSNPFERNKITAQTRLPAPHQGGRWVEVAST